MKFLIVHHIFWFMHPSPSRKFVVLLLSSCSYVIDGFVSLKNQPTTHPPTVFFKIYCNGIEIFVFHYYWRVVETMRTWWLKKQPSKKGLSNWLLLKKLAKFWNIKNSKKKILCWRFLVCFFCYSRKELCNESHFRDSQMHQIAVAAELSGVFIS